MTEQEVVQPRAMRDTFLQSLYETMLQDSEVFFLSADFGSPVVDKIRLDKPDRFINVGIAEQNLINVSVGLALEGFKVFAYAIAPFITMRCFEQIRVSMALLSEVRPMNINLIGVGAGYSYVVSGPTHQCYEDLSLMRTLPNMQFYSPADQITASSLPAQCLLNMGPKYLRLDAQVLPVIYAKHPPDFEYGFHEHRQGEKVCLIATGYMLHTALSVADRLTETDVSVGVIDLFDLSGFDENRLQSILANYQGIVTMEEGFSRKGGLDALMFNYISQRNMNLRLLNLGIEGYRFEIGERQALHEQNGIGVNSVVEKAKTFSQSLTGCCGR